MLQQNPCNLGCLSATSFLVVSKFWYYQEVSAALLDSLSWFPVM